MQFPTMLNNMFTGLLPMFQIGWTADYPDPHSFAYPFMYSEGPIAGLQHYSNPEVDALIEQGIAATTPSEREDIYFELQDLYYEDAPSILLAQTLGRRYFRDWVKGFIFNPIDPADIGHAYNLSKEYD